MIGSGPSACSVEERTDVVGRSYLRATSSRGEGGVAVAGRDVEHAFAGRDVDGFAQHFADDLQARADHGVVAGRPRALLTRFDRVEVDGGRRGHDALLGLGVGPRVPARDR